MAKKSKEELRLVAVGGSEFCQRCGDLIGPSYNCAGGRGRKRDQKQHRIMVVGEAPGYDEVRQAEFFVGVSGLQLDRWLDEAGAGNVWYDNAVRCEIGAGHLGRLTSAQATKMVTNCRPYLFQEAGRLKPNVIIALGNHALKSLTGQSGIQRWRGRKMIHPTLNCWIVPTYHPAAVLRGRPEWENVVIGDLKYAVSLSKSKPPRIKREHIFVQTQEQFDQCIAELESSEAFVLDYETTRLNAFDPELQIIGLALAASELRGYFVPFMGSMEVELKSGEKREVWDGVERIKPAWKKKIKALFESPKRVKIIQNAAYDFILLRREGWDCYPIFDTQIVNSTIDSIDNGLKNMVWLYTDFGAYEDELESWFRGLPVKNRNYAFIPPPVLAEYAARDGMGTTAVYNAHQYHLKTDKKKSARLVAEQNEMRYNLTVLEWEGVLIDKDYTQGLRDRYSKEVMEQEKIVHRALGKINLNSTEEMSNALWLGGSRKPFLNLGRYDIRPGKKDGLYPTDKEALQQVLRDSKVTKSKKNTLEAFLRYRLLSKRISTYLDNWLGSPDGRAHTSYRQDIARTGRLSSASPNLQNIPRDPEMRNCLIADPGYWLAEFDYSQLEICIAAELSGDRIMLDLINSGGDIHSFVGMHTIKKPDGTKYDRDVFIHNKEMRAKAKVVGFSIIYGKTPLTLADDLGCSIDEAAEIIQLLLDDTFPGLRDWIHKQWAFVAKYGRADSIFGRVRPIDGAQSQKSFEVERARRLVVNTPIQSAASDCVVIGFNRIAKELRKRAWKNAAAMRLTVHDSILAQVLPDRMDEYLHVGKKLLEKRIPEIKRVKLSVDAAVSKKGWGDLKEIELAA